MFTGLVEETGVIRRVKRSSQGAALTIGASRVLEGLAVGDSVATNGVCLTVTSIGGDSFTVDVMGETMRRSSLKSAAPGARVNLERALRLGDRLGGHLVSGHTDGTGTVAALEREDNAVWVKIAAEPDLLRYIVQKGSIAIDGVSLTVAEVEETGFSVSVIPHTGAETTLLDKKPGDLVNLECDVIGKYVERLMAPSGKAPAPGLDLAFLSQHGYA